MDSFPKPNIVGNYLDDSLQPPMPAMRLRWDSSSFGLAERRWYFPQHLTLTGPAPERFGLAINRRESDAYTLRLLWNDLYLTWTGLSRLQILSSTLTPLVRALGQDLWHLLNQPVQTVGGQPAKAA